jgi:hypothetical protein
MAQRVQLPFANNDFIMWTDLYDGSILEPTPANPNPNAFKAIQPFFSFQGIDNQIRSYGPGIGVFEEEFGTDQDAGNVKMLGHNFLIARQGLKAPGGVVEGCRLMDDKAKASYVMITVRINKGVKISKRTTQTTSVDVGAPVPVKFVSILTTQIADLEASERTLFSSFTSAEFAAKFGEDKQERITTAIKYKNGKFDDYNTRAPLADGSDEVVYIPLMVMRVKGRGTYGNNYQFQMTFDGQRDGNLTDGRRYTMKFQKMNSKGITSIVGATSQQFNFALNPDAVIVPNSEISDNIVDRFKTYRAAGYLPILLKYNYEGYQEIIDNLGNEFTPVITDDNSMIDFIFGKDVTGNDYKNILRAHDTVDLSGWVNFANGDDGDVFSTANVGNYLIELDGKTSAKYPYKQFENTSNGDDVTYFPEYITPGESVGPDDDDWTDGTETKQYFETLEVALSEYKKFKLPSIEYETWSTKRHTFYTWFTTFFRNTIEEQDLVAWELKRLGEGINPNKYKDSDIKKYDPETPTTINNIQSIMNSKKYTNTRLGLPEALDSMTAILYDSTVADRVGTLLNEDFKIGNELLLKNLEPDVISALPQDTDGNPIITLSRVYYTDIIDDSSVISASGYIYVDGKSEVASGNLNKPNAVQWLDENKDFGILINGDTSQEIRRVKTRDQRWAEISKHLNDCDFVDTSDPKRVSNFIIAIDLMKDLLGLDGNTVAELQSYFAGVAIDGVGGWITDNSGIFGTTFDYFNAYYSFAYELAKLIDGIKTLDNMVTTSDDTANAKAFDIPVNDGSAVQEFLQANVLNPYFVIRKDATAFGQTPPGYQAMREADLVKFIETYAVILLDKYDEEPNAIGILLPSDLDDMMYDLMISEYTWNDVMVTRLGSERFPNLDTKGQAVRAGLLIDFYAGNIDISLLDRRIVRGGVTFDAFNDISVKNYMGGTFGSTIRTDVAVFQDLGEDHFSEATVEGLAASITAAHPYGGVYRLIQNGYTTDRTRSIRTSGSYEMIYKMFEEFNKSSFKWLAGFQSNKISRMDFEWYPVVTPNNVSIGNLEKLKCIFATRLDDKRNLNTDEVDLYYMSDDSTYGQKYSVLASMRNTLLLGHIIRTVDQTVAKHTHQNVEVQIAAATKDLENQFATPIFPKDTPITFNMVQSANDMITNTITVLLAIGFPNVGSKYRLQVDCNRKVNPMMAQQ